jgi:hypothetical protein
VTFNEPEFSSTVLDTDSALTNRFFYVTLKKIGDRIWAAISNKVEIWEIATQSLIYTVVLEDTVCFLLLFYLFRVIVFCVVVLFT